MLEGTVSLLLAVAICDVIKQNQSEVGNIDFKIEPNKAEFVFLFPIVFGILQLLISLVPIDQFH